MADLIDRQVVMLKNLLRSAAKELLAHRSGAVIWRDVAEILVDNDVVVVVRCKDCKHWSIRPGNEPTKDYFCEVNENPRIKLTRSADDFCSYGERKENETD